MLRECTQHHNQSHFKSAASIGNGFSIDLVSIHIAQVPVFCLSQPEGPSEKFPSNSFSSFYCSCSSPFWNFNFVFVFCSVFGPLSELYYITFSYLLFLFLFNFFFFFLFMFEIDMVMWLLNILGFVIECVS